MAPTASSARSPASGSTGGNAKRRPAPALAPREKPARERAPHEEAEVLADAQRHDLVLHVTTDERVVHLHRRDRRPLPGALPTDGVRDLGGGEVAHAVVAHEPTVDEVVERAQRLLDSHRPVGPVQLEQVDVVDVEPAQTGLGAGNDVAVRQSRVVRARGAEPHLRRDEQLVAVGAQDRGQDLFRLTR